MKRIFLIISLLTATYVSAQQKSDLHWGIGFGNNIMNGKMEDTWKVKQLFDDYSSYFDYNNSSVESYGGIKYGELTAEYSVSKRLSVTSGLRYSNYKGNVTPVHNTNFFYLRSDSDDDLIFYRVDKLSETAGFISIPLEVNLLLLGVRSNWQWYIKQGVEAGIKVNGKKAIQFHDKLMEKHSDELFNTAGKENLNNLYSTLYSTLGIKLVLKNNIRIMFEGRVSFFLSQNNFSFLKQEPLPGTRLAIQFPIK